MRTVKIYQGEIEVNCDNLNRIDYSKCDCEALDCLCERLQKVYSPNLEETALTILEKIGKMNRVYLTGFEEQLLVL